MNALNIYRRGRLMPEFIISTDKIIETILNGHVDASLDAISNTIKMRRGNLNDRKILFISPGDIVKFNSETRPKYLQGLEAEVIKTNKTTLTVKIKEESKFLARKYGYGSFRTPISLVDKVE
jgi:hypothetical protein